MTKRLSIASALLVALSALMALLLVATPALAGQDEEHGKSKADSKQEQFEDRDHDGDADSDANTAKDESNDGDADDATDPNADEDDNAHPSGNDKSVENGGSGTQGKSESNPDDSVGPTRYEGELGDDKAGGPGGTDLSDQDGNNGCGNDDDFDDDNNGWCGKPQEEEVAPPVVGGEGVEQPTCPKSDVMPGTSGSHGCIPPDVVLGDEVENTCPDKAMDDTVAGGALDANKNCDVVLGDVLSNTDDDEVAAAAATRPSILGAPLPFTGTSIVLFLVIALGLLGVGAALLRTRRN